MKNIFSTISTKWRRMISAVALVLIFFVPVTRTVLGKVVKSNANIKGNENPAQANWGNEDSDSESDSNSDSDSESSESVSSMSEPSTASTASPDSNSDPTTESSGSDSDSGSKSNSITDNYVMPKKK